MLVSVILVTLQYAKIRKQYAGDDAKYSGILGQDQVLHADSSVLRVKSKKARDERNLWCVTGRRRAAAVDRVMLLGRCII
jgi:hypothetical protein